MFERPCGECPACQQLAAETHPDVVRLEPAEAAKTIGVDAVRQVNERLHLTGGGGTKVGVIQPADALSINAANSLLKTLEEPPAGSQLLLVSQSSGRLPATLRSRCQRIGFGIPDTETAIHWLQGSGIADAEAWLARAGGAPLLARELARTTQEGDTGADPVDALLAVLTGAKSPVAAALGVANVPLDTVIRAWIATIEDLQRLRSAQAPRLLLSWRQEELRPAAEQVDARRLFEYLGKLYSAIPAAGNALRGAVQIEGLLVEAAGTRRRQRSGGN